MLFVVGADQRGKGAERHRSSEAHDVLLAFRNRALAGDSQLHQHAIKRLVRPGIFQGRLYGHECHAGNHHEQRDHDHQFKQAEAAGTSRGVTLQQSCLTSALHYLAQPPFAASSADHLNHSTWGENGRKREISGAAIIVGSVCARVKTPESLAEWH